MPSNGKFYSSWIVHHIQRLALIILTSWLVPELSSAFRRCCCPVLRTDTGSAVSLLAAILAGLGAAPRSIMSCVVLSQGWASGGLGLPLLYRFRVAALAFHSFSQFLGVTCPWGQIQVLRVLSPRTTIAPTMLGPQESTGPVFFPSTW